MSDLPVWGLALMLAAGHLLGLAYFQSLRWTSDRLASGQGWPLAVVVTFGRLALLGGALVLASRQGAVPLLLMALGVLIARSVAMRRARISLA